MAVLRGIRKVLKLRRRTRTFIAFRCKWGIKWTLRPRVYFFSLEWPFAQVQALEPQLLTLRSWYMHFYFPLHKEKFPQDKLFERMSLCISAAVNK